MKEDRRLVWWMLAVLSEVAKMTMAMTVVPMLVVSMTVVMVTVTTVVSEAGGEGALKTIATLLRMKVVTMS